MDKVFIQILNMSLTASYVILFVLIARLLLRKAPKIFAYALWSVVLFRLICPFSFESILSLIPQSVPEITAPPRYYTVTPPVVGTPEWQEFIFSSDHSAYTTGQVWTFYDVIAIVWIVGIAAFLIYSVVSLLRLRSKLVGSIKWHDNIYFADNIPSPFVMGIARPKVYIPSTLGEDEREYIILHEQTHIRRFDYIWKIVAFFALVVHWFNPLVWLSYVLCIRDMEMSCDESVMKNMDTDIRGKYSASLLSLATGRKIIASMPLAFGEGDTKSRIKNVINYKKPTLWISIIAVVAVLVVGIGLLINPVKNNISNNLIEFDVIYSDETEYSYSVQFRNNGTLYSDYVINNELQVVNGVNGLNEVGFATGDKGEKYRIFERDGYSIDEFIVVLDDGFMNPATIYTAINE